MNRKPDENSIGRRLIIRNFPVEFDDDTADLLGIQESKSAQNQKQADFDELVKNVLRDYKEIADESRDK